MIQRLPVRLSVPLLVFCGGIIASWISYGLNLDSTEREVIEQHISAVRDDLNHTRVVLEATARMGDTQLAQRYVASYGSEPLHVVAYAAGPDGTITMATNFALIDRSIDESEQRRPPDGFFEKTAREQSAIWLDHTDGFVAGATSICGYRGGCGFFYYEEDIGPSQARARADLQVQAAVQSIVTLFVSAIVAILLHMTFVSRLHRILETAEAFGAGDRHVRTNLAGSDEFARLGRSLDDLLANVQSAHDAMSGLNRDFSEAQRIALVGNWTRHLDTGELTWSDQVFAIFDVDPEEFDSTIKAFRERVHPDDLDRVGRDVQKAIEGHGIYSTVHRVVRRDGTVRHVRENAEVERTPGGRPVLMRGTVQDITDSVLASQAAQESEQRIRAVFDNTTEGLAVIDEKGIITDFNKAAARIFKCDAASAIGTNIARFAPDAIRAEHDRYISTYMRTDKAKIIGAGRNLTALRSDGTEFPIHLGIGEVRLQDRRYFIGAVTDLSQIKGLEDQVRHAQKMDIVGQMAGGIAHDFNNLLGIIIGNADLMKRRLDDTEKLRSGVERIERAAERGAGLTRRLLDLSKQSPGLTEVMNANGSVSDLQDLFNRSLTSRIAFETRLETDLWNIEIEGDAFEDALLNLAINARDAMPSGGTLVIGTRNRSVDADALGDDLDIPAGDYVEISVSDSGTGMSSETREKIFEPFFTTKETGRGTGLGLATVYAFVRRSNGAIKVDSEEGRGTTFTMYFPRSLLGSSPGSQHTIGDVGDEFNGSESILIVDDEPALRDVANETLTQHGYATRTAANAEEALEMLRSGAKFDLVFSDVVMPGQMDGIDLARRIRSDWPSVKTLLTSGFVSHLALENESDISRNDILTKPYRHQVMLERVRQVLDGRR